MPIQHQLRSKGTMPWWFFASHTRLHKAGSLQERIGSGKKGGKERLQMPGRPGGTTIVGSSPLAKLEELLELPGQANGKDPSKLFLKTLAAATTNPTPTPAPHQRHFARWPKQTLGGSGQCSAPKTPLRSAEEDEEGWLGLPRSSWRHAGSSGRSGTRSGSSRAPRSFERSADVFSRRWSWKVLTVPAEGACGTSPTCWVQWCWSSLIGRWRASADHGCT
mmetsp:Transcript_69494/g.214802  ORF Transcript_69494/g.214802 Transcript_69494/m.214802 type:complete len:220 (+) Transcript_69494:837-1496(+)